MSRLAGPSRGLQVGLAVIGGLALWAGHPPVGWSWLGLVAVAPLAGVGRLVGRGARPVRTGFGAGLLAGLCFFLPLLEWIRHIGEWAALPLLAVSQAVFVGAFVAGVAWWGERAPAPTGGGLVGHLAAAWWRPAMIAGWWVALELVRSSVPLGGFPWGVLGYTQADGGPVLGVARVLGVLGVSLVCAAIGACAEELVHRIVSIRRGSPKMGWDPEQAFAAARTPLVTVLALVVASVLIGSDPPAPTGATVDVGIVQGVSDDSTGQSATRAAAIAARMVETTQEMVAEGGAPELTVWPETALDGDPDEVPALAEAAIEALDLIGGAPLLTGLDRWPDDEPDRFRRTMTLFAGDDLTPRGEYDKRRPVPFGEYVPYRAVLGVLAPLQRTPRDAIPGQRAVAIEAAGTRLGPLLCFDVAYPQIAREAVVEGAEILVVGTNNVSYGPSAMSDQHIAFSQLRAVETGRHVVHAALTGRSAFVDPDGVVSQRTGSFTQAIARTEVPVVAAATVWNRIGDAGTYALCALLALGVGARIVALRLVRADGRGMAPPPAGG